jgi:hypothetical protein
MSRVIATGNLRAHGDTPCEWLSDIMVTVTDEGDALTIAYHAVGDIEEMKLPEEVSHQRRDELWKTTCFEAFLGFADGGYAEYNFAPAGDWAAYHFSGYREGMTQADVPAPEISAEGNDYMLLITAKIKKPDAAITRLGLAAVIEDWDDEKSYWALRHPDGKPDFHHADCFAVTLAAGQ